MIALPPLFSAIFDLAILPFSLLSLIWQCTWYMKIIRFIVVTIFLANICISRSVGEHSWIWCIQSHGGWEGDCYPVKVETHLVDL